MENQPGTNESEAMAQPSSEKLDFVFFNWPEIGRGDCRQRGGRLTLYSDGTGFWSCTTWTYHTTTHDVWHCNFIIRSAQGAELFRTPRFSSPDMDDGNPPPEYHWGKPFVFNPDLFEAAKKGTAAQYCSC